MADADGAVSCHAWKGIVKETNRRMQPGAVLESRRVDPDAASGSPRTMSRLCSSRFERAARKLGWTRIAGIDEAGRGALFGPVVAAAVILNPKRRIVGLDDSKKLAADRRTELSARIREHALAWAVAEIDAQRIDAWNIYQASRQAMIAALQQLTILPDYLLIDAMQLDVLIEQKSLIKGDARSVSIAAASILAKTHRDRRMEEWDAIYPQYGLARHKGYATPDHLEALRQHGPSPLHRYSFAPVRESGCWAAGATQTFLPIF
jgi:ribonuclease HII